MITLLIAILTAIAVVFLPSPDCWLAGAVGEFALTIVDIMQGYPVAAAIGAACTLFYLLMWWRQRKIRKRAPRAYGAKSRARLARLVRTVSERSVLRPMPQGA